MKSEVSSGTRGVGTKKYEYKLNLEAEFELKKDLEDKERRVHRTSKTDDLDISNAERA